MKAHTGHLLDDRVQIFSKKPLIVASILTMILHHQNFFFFIRMDSCLHGQTRNAIPFH